MDYRLIACVLAYLFVVESKGLVDQFKESKGYWNAYEHYWKIRGDLFLADSRNEYADGRGREHREVFLHVFGLYLYCQE